MNLPQREAAWRVFREWERDHPTKPSDLAEIMVRIDEILAFARRAGTLIEEPPQEKAARLARVRAILARLALGS